MATKPWPGRAAPVVAGVALLWLAGCTSSPPVLRYQGWSGDSTTAPSPSYTPPPSYSPPRYVQPPPDPPPPAINNPPPPLRPVDPDPPALHFSPSVTFLSPPADAIDCTGWWRICHFY